MNPLPVLASLTMVAGLLASTATAQFTIGDSFSLSPTLGVDSSDGFFNTITQDLQPGVLANGLTLDVSDIVDLGVNISGATISTLAGQTDLGGGVFQFLLLISAFDDSGAPSPDLFPVALAPDNDLLEEVAAVVIGATDLLATDQPTFFLEASIDVLGVDGESLLQSPLLFTESTTDVIPLLSDTPEFLAVENNDGSLVGALGFTLPGFVGEGVSTVAFAAIVTTVPEPAAATMLVAASVVALLSGRQRRKR